MKKQFLIISILCIAFITSAQTYHGAVKNTKDEIVPFANVVFYSLPDSIFVAGTTTNNEGNFLLKNENNTRGYLEISFIGYETQIVSTCENIGTIILKESANDLGEVLIKGRRPTFKMEANGILAKVENTMLSRLGTANEVLAQLPFVNENEGKINVFGGGEPIIYVNNRLLRDTGELQQIDSKNIRSVKIILNPGAEYDATIGSVILITTKKTVGEGFSGSIYSYIKQTRETDTYGRVKLNYRKRTLDIFGGADIGRWKGKNYQTDGIEIHNGGLNKVLQDIILKGDRRQYSANAGVNYNISKTHSVGLRYEYANYPHKKMSFNGTSTHYLDGLKDNALMMHVSSDGNTKKNYLNGYYHGKLSDKTEMHFDGDWIKGRGETPQTAINTNNNSTTTVRSESANNYVLYAGKLWLRRAFWKGKTTIGVESSYTENKQSYHMLNEQIAEDLPSNRNSSDQTLIATFLTYNFSVKRFTIEVGTRYEYIDFNYFLNGVQKEEQSKIYNNLSPNFSIAYKGKAKMSLSYRKTIKRPSYSQLRSSISYYDPYTYEGGNPALQPTFINKLTYLFGWKDVQAMLAYSWYKNQVIFMAEQFEDKSILLFTTKNVNHSKMLAGGISYSPKIAFWKPTFLIGFEKQYLTINNTDFNKIGFYAQWKNMLKLPYKFVMAINMKGGTGGNNGIMKNKSFFNADLSLNKQFLNKRLNASVIFSDIFNTNRTKWETRIGNIGFNKWNSTDIRGVKFQVTYNFNATRDKYKGKKATDEMNRL